MSIPMLIFTAAGCFLVWFVKVERKEDSTSRFVEISLSTRFLDTSWCLYSILIQHTKWNIIIHRPRQWCLGTSPFRFFHLFSWRLLICLCFSGRFLTRYWEILQNLQFKCILFCPNPSLLKWNLLSTEHLLKNSWKSFLPNVMLPFCNSTLRFWYHICCHWLRKMGYFKIQQVKTNPWTIFHSK